MNVIYKKSWTNKSLILSCPGWLGKIFPSLDGRHLRLGVWAESTIDQVKKPDSNVLRRSNIRYEPLRSDEFRVLLLQPGTFKSPLRINMITAQSSEFSDYDAVSYTWGQSSLSKYMESDGETCSITDTIDDMLRFLRSPSDTRALWIDQICINQDDIQEKSHQVAMMGSIYSNAEHVHVWLGAASATSGLAMKFLGSFFHDRCNFDNTPIESYPREQLLEGLTDVMSRSWFARIWVVQEASLSASIIVQCGYDSFGWTSEHRSMLKNYIRRIKYVESHPTWEQAGFSSIFLAPLLHVLEIQLEFCRSFSFVDESEELKFANALLDIMHSNRLKKAGDPRDKMYALMGLAAGKDGFSGGDQSQVMPAVNYNVPVEETFKNLSITLDIR